MLPVLKLSVVHPQVSSNCKNKMTFRWYQRCLCEICCWECMCRTNKCSRKYKSSDSD